MKTLTKTAAERLADLERVVDACLPAMQAVAAGLPGAADGWLALQRIHDSGDYQPAYGTWANYLKVRFGLGKTLWYGLQQRLGVALGAADAPGPRSSAATDEQPQDRGQIAPLEDLPPGAARLAWLASLAAAGGQPTPEQVADAAAAQKARLRAALGPPQDPRRRDLDRLDHWLRRAADVARRLGGEGAAFVEGIRALRKALVDLG